MFRLLERPEDAGPSEPPEQLAAKIKTLDSLASAHELVYQVVVAIVQRLRKAGDPTAPSDDDHDQGSGAEEEYVKLEKELQKYEAKVRTYIRVDFW